MFVWYVYLNRFTMGSLFTLGLMTVWGGKLHFQETGIWFKASARGHATQAELKHARPARLQALSEGTLEGNTYTCQRNTQCDSVRVAVLCNSFVSNSWERIPARWQTTFSFGGELQYYNASCSKGWKLHIIRWWDYSANKTCTGGFKRFEAVSEVWE